MKDYKIDNKNYSGCLTALAKDMSEELDGKKVFGKAFTNGEITEILYREGRILVELSCSEGFKTFDLRLGISSGSISFAEDVNEALRAYIAVIDRLESERRKYLDDMLVKMCEESARRHTEEAKRKAELERQRAEQLAAEKAAKKKEAAERAAEKRRLAKEALQRHVAEYESKEHEGSRA